jgi:putative ABC transport system permease protein
MLEMIRNDRSVDRAEARRVLGMRVRVAGLAAWTTLDLVAVEDFPANSVNLLRPVEGRPEPDKQEVVLELDALRHVHDAEVGVQLEFQLSDGSIRSMPVVGIVQDTAMGAGDFLAAPYGYITTSTLSWLGESPLYDRLFITVSEGGDDIVHIRDVGAALKERLEKNGTIVIRSRFSESHEHPLASTINAVLGILMALGILIVFLSGSLIANTLNALLVRHLRHIGVIKLLGGRRRQVIVLYLVLILAFALLALAVAVPWGGQGAYGLASYIAGKLNFNLLGYRIVPSALAVQIVVGLLIPLVAGIVPVSSGSRITVLRALSGDLGREEAIRGAHHPARVPLQRIHWLDRLQLGAARRLAARGLHLPRPFVISLRNTFRRKGRLALTLFTLTMGGAIFIAVFNVRSTLHDYIRQIGRYFVADISVVRPTHGCSKSAGGIANSECRSWRLAVRGGRCSMAAGRSWRILTSWAPASLIEPSLIEGRWLLPDDERILAVSEAVLSYFPDLRAGDSITLDIEGEEQLWQVAGIFRFVDREGILAYAPFEYVSRMNNLTDRAFVFRMITERHDRGYQDAKAEELDAYLRSRGYKVHQSEAGTAALDVAVESLDTLVVFLLIMAILTATVGSMGLAGTMGMNVLERTREIGVMRAIGADDRTVMRTVLAEGMVIGILSFGLAILMSVPLTYLLATIVSLAVFETPVPVVFSWSGYLIWLGLVLAFRLSLPCPRAFARLPFVRCLPTVACGVDIDLKGPDPAGIIVSCLSHAPGRWTRHRSPTIVSITRCGHRSSLS